MLAGVYIKGSQEKNKKLFDALAQWEVEITSNFGSELEWETPR